MLKNANICLINLQWFTIFQVVVFDFQPRDPENVFVALSALSGRQVPGELCCMNQILGYNIILILMW